MKKLFTLLLLTLVTISCSSDDSSSDSNNSSETKITPPSWIQGLWKPKDSDANVGYRFTSNDFCQIIPQMDNCWKSTIENANALIPVESAKTKVGQEISDNKYSITMIAGGVQSYKFEFKKISNTEIVWTNAPGFNEENTWMFTYVKQ